MKRRKLLQKFILGYSGDIPSNLFLNLIKEGLGGVIFFTHNIKTVQQFKNVINLIKTVEDAKCPLFLSIDQEGGRVERTLNLHNGSRYFSAKDVTRMGIDFAKTQTKEIARELITLGINMNFAPVLDVNTNPNNPIIAERSYSDNPDVVSSFAKVVNETFLDNGIITVGKHFPGHGDTNVDSHDVLPKLLIDFEKLEKTHIKPFKDILHELPAIMIAHIYYSAFDSDVIPASVSKNVITKYLRQNLGYQGLILSDDMVMGGIKNYTSFDACKLGIDAGIDMFIFRTLDENVLDLFDNLLLAYEKNALNNQNLDDSYNRIVKFKRKTLTNV